MGCNLVVQRVNLYLWRSAGALACVHLIYPTEQLRVKGRSSWAVLGFELSPFPSEVQRLKR